MPRKAVAIATITTAALALASTWSTATARPVASNAAAHAPHIRAAARFVVAPTGNEARYRVREHLMGVSLPNDAVGVTRKITGSITVDEHGAIVPGESHIVVDVTTLKSDRERRDGYVQRRLLDTEHFPTVELVPTTLRGLPAPLPSGHGTVGPQQLEMVGDLTVRGVTHPTTWRVNARYEDGRVTGTAATAFTFADFNLVQPRVPVVMSVADTIALEYDFTLVRQP